MFKEKVNTIKYLNYDGDDDDDDDDVDDNKMMGMLKIIFNYMGGTPRV